MFQLSCFANYFALSLSPHLVSDRSLRSVVAGSVAWQLNKQITSSFQVVPKSPSDIARSRLSIQNRGFLKPRFSEFP